MNGFFVPVGLLTQDRTRDLYPSREKGDTGKRGMELHNIPFVHTFTKTFFFRPVVSSVEGRETLRFSLLTNPRPLVWPVVSFWDNEVF